MIWRVLRLVDLLSAIWIRLLQRLELYRCRRGSVNYPKGTRFVRRVFFRGTRGQVKIGKGVEFGHGNTMPGSSISIQARNPGSEIIIGDDCHFSANVSIVAVQSIQIGSRLLCGNGVIIMDCDFHPVNPGLRQQGCGLCRPVRIGSNVWLGDGVKVLKGVSIGDGSVIAAGAIVTSDVPSSSVAAGVPARVVKNI